MFCPFSLEKAKGLPVRMSRKVPECSLAFIVPKNGATAAPDNGKTRIMGLLKGAEQ